MEQSLEMDIIDVKTNFGNKYNKRLTEMIDYPYKKGLIIKYQARVLKRKCK